MHLAMCRVSFFTIFLQIISLRLTTALCNTEGEAESRCVREELPEESMDAVMRFLWMSFVLERYSVFQKRNEKFSEFFIRKNSFKFKWKKSFTQNFLSTKCNLQTYIWVHSWMHRTTILRMKQFYSQFFKSLIGMVLLIEEIFWRK